MAERNARGDPQLAVLHTLREHLFIVVVPELGFMNFYFSIMVTTYVTRVRTGLRLNIRCYDRTIVCRRQMLYRF